MIITSISLVKYIYFALTAYGYATANRKQEAGSTDIITRYYQYHRLEHMKMQMKMQRNERKGNPNEFIIIY